jgi:hypothetical protein
MYRLRQFARVALAGLFIAMLAVAGLADTIRLKDGSIIKGTITGFAGGKFTVEVGQGSRKRQLVFDATEVESVVFEQIIPAGSAAGRTNSHQTVPRTEAVVAKTNAENDTVPVTIVEDTSENTSPPVATLPATTSATSAKPIELSLKVRSDNASNGWTNTGWVVKKGQRIRISGTGEVSIGNGKTSTPGGLWDLEDETKLLKAVPTGALIAVIGDDNNDFIYIGNDREFTASRDGSLFLGVNEGNLNDNTGSYDAKVEIFPGS